MARKRDKNQAKRIVTDLFADEPKIEMLGNREMIIDGCKGVVEY